MTYKVYEWDSIKRVGVLKHTEKERGIALYKGKLIAQKFCEDEKPMFMDMRNGIYFWETDCDFCAKIVKEE